MKKVLLSAALLAACTALPATAGAQKIGISDSRVGKDSIAVCAWWSAGEKMRFEVTTESSTTQDGQESGEADKTSTIVLVNVTDETDTSYTLEFGYYDFWSSDFKTLDSRTVDFTKDALRQVRIEVRTDEWGQVDTIFVDDAYARLMLSLSELEQAYAEADAKDPALNKKARSEYKKLYSRLKDQYASGFSPATLKRVAENDFLCVLKYHACILDTTRLYNDTAELGTSGTRPVSVWVDSKYTDSAELVIRTYSEAGNDAVRPFIESQVRASVLASASSEAEAAAAFSEWQAAADELHQEYSMKVYELFDIDAKTGWPLQYSYESHIILSNDESTADRIDKKDIYQLVPDGEDAAKD